MNTLPTMKIKGKDYVMVKDRVAYLRENFTGKYQILTEYHKLESTYIVKATLMIKNDDEWLSYVGHCQEVEGQGHINKTSALENAETGAIGRACAAAGIGILSSYASADEVLKAKNRESVNDQLVMSLRMRVEDLLRTADIDFETAERINDTYSVYDEEKLRGCVEFLMKNQIKDTPKMGGGISATSASKAVAEAVENPST